MRLMKTLPILASALLATGLAACDGDNAPATADASTGGGDTATGGSDTSTGGTDTATGGSDTSSGGSDTATGGSDTMTPTDGCSRTGFNIVASAFEGQTGYASFQASNATEAPYDVLAFGLYSAGEYAGVGATGPGTYALNDPNYKTCANCVLIFAGCDSEQCEKTFYADAGELVIDRWDAQGGRFSGTLRNVKLTEVTIDDSDTSTPVDGGETWCIPSLPFDAEIAALPVSDRTQPTCVAEGTGSILDDNVKAVTWKNCLGEDVKLHDSCGQAKAFWLVATAGWCSACTSFLADLVEQHEVTTLTREAVRTKTPGLDLLVILGENANQEKPTAEYCLSYANSRKLDPAMVVMDWSDAGIPVPLISPEGSAISANALGTTWDAVNPYLSADSSGSVTSSYPWWALLDGRNMRYHWSDNAQRSDFQTALGELLSAE